jgi:hypothetical protein
MPATYRSPAQSPGGFGAGTPGRSRGTQTRSTPGQTAQATGADITIDSPSTPTGICGHHGQALQPSKDQQDHDRQAREHEDEARQPALGLRTRHAVHGSIIGC